MHSGRRYL